MSEFLREAVARPLDSHDAADLAITIAQSGVPSLGYGVSPLTSVHSTGAPGSLSTLLAPALAAASGAFVPLVSVPGRVAGAIDSLSLLPSYNARLDDERFAAVLCAAGLAHIGHSDGFAPADRVLWELREKVEGAKAAPAMIAASILGKKLATGVKCGVVDIRVGRAGNAGETLEAATETARLIIDTAQILEMRVTCVLSDARRLSWPRIGRPDALIAVERILAGHEGWASEHVHLALELAVAACHAADPSKSADMWRQRVEDSARSRRALETFHRSIHLHGAGGDGLMHVQRIAQSRHEIKLAFSGDPEPTSISTFFKQARKVVDPETGGYLGVGWDRGEQTLSIHLIRDDFRQKICEFASSIQPCDEGFSPFAPILMRFDGSSEQI